MRLAFKLVLVVVILVAIVLMGEAFLHIEHEAELHTADIQHEQHSQGLILTAALRLLGPLESAQSRSFIEAAQKMRLNHSVWLLDASTLRQGPSPLDTGSDLPELVRRAALATLLAGGEDTLHLVYEFDEHTYLYSFSPLSLSESGDSALIIQRAPLQPRSDYILSGLKRIAVQGAALLLLAALAAIWFGQRLVTRPVEILTHHAREISKGNFDHPASLRGEGELPDLEQELLKMAATLKSAHETLQQETQKHITALEQLRHTDRLRTVGTLAAGVAHDLGTPLQIALGRAERIVRKSKDAQLSQGAQVIIDQVVRMDQIVRQLMRFAAPRRDEGVGEQKQDLRALVANACQLVAPLDRKVLIDLQLGDAPIEVAVSPDHVEQLVVNLVANAIDASKEGDTVTVAMSVVREEGVVYGVLYVSDEGDGMPPEIIEQVFDPFFTTKPVGSGTGLGLAIVYGIIQQYGGQVRASNAEGSGARFEVLFPLDQTRAAPLDGR